MKPVSSSSKSILLRTLRVLTLTTLGLLAVAPASRLTAAPLDPNVFVSLGANPFTQAGTCTIDTVGGRVVRVPASHLTHSPGKPLKPL